MKYNDKIGILENVKLLFRERNNLNGRIQNENAKSDKNSEEISVTTETLEAVMEEVLPQQVMTTDELFETVDTILTEIIPSLMMDNE